MDGADSGFVTGADAVPSGELAASRWQQPLEIGEEMLRFAAP